MSAVASRFLAQSIATGVPGRRHRNISSATFRRQLAKDSLSKLARQCVHLRARKREFCKAVQGRISCPVRRQKKYRLFCRANQAHSLPRPALTLRGVSRSSRTLAAGCDGRSNATDECVCIRTAKSCGFGAPTLALSLRDDLQATVANKPGHRKEHEASRKTVVQGKPES